MCKKFIDITEEIYAQFTTDMQEQLKAASSDAEKKYLASESISLLMAEVIKTENLSLITIDNGEQYYQMTEENVNELFPFLDRLKDIMSQCIKDGLLPLQEEDVERMIGTELLQTAPLYMDAVPEDQQDE